MASQSFGTAVTSLSSNIAAVTTSLYDLQKMVQATSSKRSGAGVDWVVFFISFRACLKGGWEQIRDFLQACHAFGDEVGSLKEALESDTPENCFEFFSEVLSIALENTERTRRLLKSSADANASFGKSAADLETLLSKSQNHDISTFSPDALSTLSTVKDSLAQIRNNVFTIRRFWQLTTETFRSFISDGTTSTLQLSSPKAESMVEEWSGYQGVILEAVKSIARSSDEILVPPNASSSGHGSAAYGQGHGTGAGSRPNYYGAVSPRKSAYANPDSGQLSPAFPARVDLAGARQYRDADEKSYVQGARPCCSIQ